MFGAFAIPQFACSLQKAQRMHHAVWQCMRISVFCGESHIIIKTEEKSRTEYCFGIQHSAATPIIENTATQSVEYEQSMWGMYKLGTSQ